MNKGFTPYIIFQRLRRFCVLLKKERSGSCITGFTLIEMVTAVAIFAVLTATLTGFFVSAVQSQQKTLASQELIDNISYNLEYLSRAMRMAKKDIDGDCITATNNYQATRSGAGIKFKNYQDNCQEFFVEGGKLKETKNGVTNDLTPPNLEIVSFSITGSESWGQGQDTQPKIILLVQARGKSQKPETQPLIKIQTMISQRNLNVTY